MEEDDTGGVWVRVERSGAAESSRGVRAEEAGPVGLLQELNGETVPPVDWV